MSKLLSLARLQDQPGRCGTAATHRPPQAAAIRCKERMAAEPQMTAMSDGCRIPRAELESRPPWVST